MRSFLEPDQIKDVYRDEHDRMMKTQIAGNATTLAALRGVAECDLSGFMKRLGDELSFKVRNDDERFMKKLREAKGRYRFWK